MNSTKRLTVLNTEFRRNVIMYRMCMKDGYFVLRSINISSRALVVCEPNELFIFMLKQRSVVLNFNTCTFKDIGYSCCISLS